MSEAGLGPATSNNGSHPLGEPDPYSPLRASCCHRLLSMTRPSSPMSGQVKADGSSEQQQSSNPGIALGDYKW